ncbi:MAG: hypothetical protein ACI88C_000040 [Acidimicrobiales bacterium]
MTSLSITTSHDGVQLALRRMIEKRGHVPYEREGAGFICPCPHCGKVIAFKPEELGLEITHDLSRCRARNTDCGLKFTINANLKGYTLAGGEQLP